LLVTGGTKPVNINREGPASDDGEKPTSNDGEKPTSNDGEKPAGNDGEEPASTSSKKKKKRPTFAFLTDTATNICRARLGPRFYDVINQCSRQYSAKAHEKNKEGDYVINMKGRQERQ
jgi:hypothetical protein